MAADRTIRLGSRVKRIGEFGRRETGVVFDLFTHEGVEYAFVEWVSRKNQYTANGVRCRVERVCLLKKV